MSDEIFENPRLVEIYDAFDGKRNDLEHYLQIAREMNATSILDIGSGTGCFACLMSKEGFDVTAIEPAKASLDKARSKKYANKVRWILGDATSLPQMKVDMVFMTGNVAQVFLEDKEWEDNLRTIKNVLNPRGHLVFETRDPERKAWHNWTPEKTRQQKNIPGIGPVEGCCEVTEVNNEHVSFVWRYYFHSDKNSLTSTSTLRFRKKDSIIQSLENIGFAVKEIRDAPDRPQQEFVFIAEVKSC